LTSEAVGLIAPDTQLTRLGYPESVPSWTGEGLVRPRVEIVLPTVDIVLPEVDIVLPEVEIVLPKGEFVRAKVVVPSRHGRLFFFDEANVSWCPQSGRIYRLAGQAAKVETPGQNHTDYLLGSLEYPSGEGLYEIYPHKTHHEVQAHWQHLLEMYPHDFLFVVRDNASSHVTPELDAFLLKHKHCFCVVPLPTYSPNLNLIERLWHYMRDQLTRSHFYPTFKELCEALVKWFQTLPFERFQSLMGIGSFP
jgi:transposase